MKEKNNYSSINIIKIIGILCLIFESLCLELDIPIKIGGAILIFCAGYRYLNSDIKTIDLIKSSLKLYLLYLFWTITYETLFQFYIGNYVDLKELLAIILVCVLLKASFHFWILKSIIILVLSSIILKHFVNKNKIVDTIILIISFILPLFNDSLIPITMYISGYYFKTYNNKFINYAFYILTVISLLFCKTFLNLFLPIFLFLILKIKNKKINSVLSFLQKQSFGIYLIYGLIIGIIDLFGIIDFKNILDIIGATILTYILSLIIITYLNFLPIIRSLVKERL